MALQKSWPATLLDFNKWPSRTQAPDLTQDKNFLTVSNHFHYEMPPHSASWYLPKGTPMFACKFVVTKMTLSDMANILLDVVDSFTTGNLPNLDLSFMDKFIAFEFHIDAQLSLIETEVFTPGMFLTAGAAGNLFGLKFDFHIDVQVPVDISIAGMIAFVKNPLSVLDNVGFKVKAEVSLPFGLGDAKLVGLLSAKRFMIECTMGMGLGSLQLAGVHVLVNYEVKKPDAFVLALHTEINLGFFGKIEAGGKVDSKSLSLYGGLDARFFGLRFCGNVQAMIDSKQKCYKTIKGKKKVVPCFFVQFDAMVKLGILGKATFLGRIENKGIKIKATLENNIEEAMESVIKDAVTLIFGEEKDSAVVKELSKTLAKITAGAIPFKRIDFELDTISDPGKLSLEIELTLLGIKVVLPKINIKIKGGGRRLNGGTPGRKYTHVEAYEAKYRRLHPEYEAEQTALEDPLQRRLFGSTIDCTKDDGGFKIADLVDMIVDAVNLPLLASKLKLCLPGLVKDNPKGESCASDNQCKDYKKFPGGLWCDRNGKPSAGIACTGTCQPRYVGTKKCPLMRNDACRSGDCICQVCANEKTKKLSHGKKCVNDGDCEGWCDGKLSAGCVGTCAAFRQTGQSCGGSVSGKLNDFKCEGSRVCVCGACSDTGGENTLTYGMKCAKDSQCKNGWCKGKSGAACTGKCAAFLKPGGDCSGSISGSVNDAKCEGSSKCVCSRCTATNGLAVYKAKCAKDSQCNNGWCDGKSGAACTGKCAAFLKPGGDCSGSISGSVNDAKCDGKSTCVCSRCTATNGRAVHGSKCAKDSQCDNGWCSGKSGAACSGTCKKFVGIGGSCGGSITAKLNDYKCTRSDGLGACKSNKCYKMKLKGTGCGKGNNWECKSGNCKCSGWKFLKCTGGYHCT